MLTYCLVCHGPVDAEDGARRCRACGRVDDAAERVRRWTRDAGTLATERALDGLALALVPGWLFALLTGLLGSEARGVAFVLGLPTIWAVWYALGRPSRRETSSFVRYLPFVAIAGAGALFAALHPLGAPLVVVHLVLAALVEFGRQRTDGTKRARRAWLLARARGSLPGPNASRARRWHALRERVERKRARAGERRPPPLPTHVRPYCLQCLTALEARAEHVLRCPECGFANSRSLYRTYWTLEPALVRLELALKVSVVLGIFVATALVHHGFIGVGGGYVIAIPLVVGVALERTIGKLTRHEIYDDARFVVGSLVFGVAAMVAVFGLATGELLAVAVAVVLPIAFLVAGAALETWKRRRIARIHRRAGH